MSGQRFCGRGRAATRFSRDMQFVGWVSRLPRLSGFTLYGPRRNPPLAQRVRLLGGLRAALLSQLAYRAVFSVANPPYVLVVL